MQFRDEDEFEDRGEGAETKEHFLKIVKDKVFYVLYRLLSTKFVVPLHYQLLLILIETFQLMTFALVNRQYSTMGPFQDQDPWNSAQTSWLIDVCWAFRVDRYLLFSDQGMILALTLWVSLPIATAGLMGVLVFLQATTPTTLFLLKAVKVLIPLLTNLLFIPSIGTYARAAKCSISDTCDDLPTGYLYTTWAICCSAVYLAFTGGVTLLYNETSMSSGNLSAKPHPRFKLLRLISYTIIIYAYYFSSGSSGSPIYLTIALAVGLITCYVYAQYVPYYHLKVSKARLASQVWFTSAIFCLIVGAIFSSTDRNNSSISMLLYFLTPCLLQIMQLALERRGKILRKAKMQQLTNPYQVELKARMLLLNFDLEKSKSHKYYGEEEIGEDLLKKQTETYEEVETLFRESFKKFPNSEFLYLWSGLFQLHRNGKFILALVQCFKGLHIANKFDSQFALYSFRRTAETIYKANMKDDAYDYVIFEKVHSTAQKHDEMATRAQFYFWSELESNSPKIQKLTKYAAEITELITVTKDDYQKVLKINSKSSSALRMYGGFLSTLNTSKDMGERYLQKSDMQDEANSKAANFSAINSLSQPLSFFDNDKIILTVSGDFEIIGEILNVTVSGLGKLGYLTAELKGRNINVIIPQPFSERHDLFMRQFHEIAKYCIVDNYNLVTYFLHKTGHIVEGRLLVKVVPNGSKTPFFMAVIKDIQTPYEVLLLNHEFVITGYTSKMKEFLGLGGTKTTDVKITASIPDFEAKREVLESPEGAMIDIQPDNAPEKRAKCKLAKFDIGSVKAWTLKIYLEEEQPQANKDDGQIDLGGTIEDKGQRAISVLRKDAAREGSDKGEDSDQSSQEESKSESEEESEESREEGTDLEGVQVQVQLEKNETDSEDEESGEASSSKGASETPGNEAMSSGSEPPIVPDPGAESPEQSLNSSKEESVGDHRDVDAVSVVSSSKSSLGSLAQFNKSIKALIAYEYRRSKKYVLHFKLSLFFTILVLILTSVMIFVVIKNSTSKNSDLSHFVSMVGDMRLFATSLCYYTRMVTLIDSGNLRLNSTQRNQYIEWMLQDSDSMHAINQKVYSKYPSLSSAAIRIYERNVVSTWVMELPGVREMKANLFDATSNLVLQSYLTQKAMRPQADGTLGTIDLKHRRAFYLYRNGMGEALSYLNKSATFYVDAAVSDIATQRLTAILLILLSVFLLLLCAGVAIVPVIRSLEKSRREVWDIFFEVQLANARAFKSKCQERLNLLNESAVVDIDERNEGGMFEENNEQDLKQKERRSKQKEEKDKKKAKQSLRSALTYDPKARKLIIVKLVCFFVVSTVYFYLIYYTGFDSVGQMLADEPVQVDWASRRKQLSRSLNLWVHEALLANVTNVGYKHVVPVGQDIASPWQHAMQLADELEFVENTLIFGNPQESIHFSDMRSNQHDLLMFSDACSAPIYRSLSDCPTVAKKAMMQGLHSALSMYVTLARTLLLQISDMYAFPNYT